MSPKKIYEGKNWEAWDDDVASAEETNERQESVAILKLEQGRNLLRFLPPQLGSGGAPWIKVWQHYVNTPEGELIVFPCPVKMYNHQCPVCDQANTLSRTGNRTDREEAYKLWPKLRVFADVIDMNDTDAGTQVFAFGKMIYEQLRSIRNDPDSGGDFTHPETGFDIIIERTGSGKFDTAYDVRAARHETKLENMNWLDCRNNLERFKAAAPNHVLDNAARAIGLLPIPAQTVEALPPASADMFGGSAAEDFSRSQ